MTGSEKQTVATIETPTSDTDSVKEVEEAVDWESHAKKWESRAKRNLKRVNELEQAVKAASDSKDEAVKQAVEPLKARLKAFEREDQMRNWKQKVTDETGIPAELLRGETLDELQSHGKALSEFLQDQVKGPVVPNVGEVPQREVSSSLQVIRSLFGTK